MMRNNDAKMDARRTSGMVKLRGGFSDRFGIVDFNKIQQINEFDDDTRIRLANRILEILNDVFCSNYDQYFGFNRDMDEVRDRFCLETINELFCERTNPYGYSLNWRDIFTNKIEPVILHATYNEVLDVIQYCCRWLCYETRIDGFYEVFNAILKKEYIGYRFLDGYVVPITDEMELREVAEVCNSQYDGPRSHIKKAVQFLADREKKDYKNCIKESISAVESICQIITGDSKATLGEALKIINKNGTMHSALAQGFLKLYGYTSDQGGIRHAEGLFESNVSFDEAKYFLVSCSAFVNYLIAEYAKGSN